jgi:hypothetical protein
MFTAQQYRADAIKYAKLVRTANCPNEVREFERLERSFTELADNAQWVTDNRNKIVQSTERTNATLTPDTAAQSISQQ